MKKKDTMPAQNLLSRPMDKNAPLSQRLKYAFENTLSKGAIAIIAWLGIVCFSIVIVFGFIFHFTGITQEGTEGMSFFEAVWHTLMRSFDAGNLAGDAGWGFRILGLLVTLGGIFVFSALIGAITSGLENKLENLRKGRSRVLETNHTLILGWSQTVIPIISELIIANENQTKPRIVILAEKDKIEMEEEIRDRIPDMKNTRIICRTGCPLDLVDLEIVNPHEAKSIIILAPEGANPDMYVIKTILALTNNPHRTPRRFFILAEITDKENLEAAKLVGGDEAIFIESSVIISRITAQSCRQSGLSIVFMDLLDFQGDEIYFAKEPALFGKTFRDALFSYETSSVFGILKNDQRVAIHPPLDSIIEEGDSCILITKDDDTAVISGRNAFSIREEVITKSTALHRQKEKNCIIGWNECGAKIVQELDNYVAPGSELSILADSDGLKEKAESLGNSMKNQSISFTRGNTTVRSTLENADITSFDNVIVLAYSGLTHEEADSKTLISLLHLRNMFETKGKKISIVSQMHDVRNRDLAEVTKADDFIVSDRLISTLISQLSENRHLHEVFEKLFTSEGSEIYLKPAGDYVKPGSEMNFYTVLKAAADRNEIAIGYRIAKHSMNPEENYGIMLNPDKSKTFSLQADDKIIVIAKE